MQLSVSKLIITLGLAAGVFTACLPSNDVGSLESIQANIEKRFPALSHITSEDLQMQLAVQSNDILILDTRPLAEYNVSHIEGAVQIDPDIKPQDFKKLLGQSAADKKLVVYCSVGWRSSIAGDRLKEAAMKMGASEISNLEGGLFGWHNEKRPLVNATGKTTLIHPYNKKWGTLVSNPDKRSYIPQ